MNVEQLSEKIAALVFFIAPHTINTAKHPFFIYRNKSYHLYKSSQKKQWKQK